MLLTRIPFKIYRWINATSRLDLLGFGLVQPENALNKVLHLPDALRRPSEPASLQSASGLLTEPTQSIPLRWWLGSLR